MSVVRKAILNKRGVALITVLLIVSILIAVAVELNRSSRAEIYDAANVSDGIKLTYIAKSGFYAGSALLVNFPHDYVSLRDEWARADLLSVRSQSFFTDGLFVVNIEDEAGKIPVHKLVNGSVYNEDIRDILIRLLKQPEFGLDDRKAGEIVDAIKDWIDPDEEVTRPGGAESSYYATLDPPYRSKNLPLDCIEELLMIKGVSRELYEGTKEKPGLAQYLTIYGDGFININTAPKMVLRALSPNITPDIAGEMDEYRNNAGNNLSNALWYQRVPGLEAATIKPVLIATKSSYFQISSSGKLNNMVRQVKGIVKISPGPRSFQVLSWRLN
jgi:general secretion pathway protein K